jgi:hypothetical protein
MIENEWEENPGIAPGDIFCNNDCLIGNVHPCDIHTIVPIFWDGSLIGWVGAVTHVIDTGRGGPWFDDHRPGATLRRWLLDYLPQSGHQRQAVA